MRVKHPAQKRQMNRMFLQENDLRVAQQLLNLRGSRDCQRCGGLLVTERMDSSADTLFDQHTSALRCIQCGDIVDPVILRNRMDPVAARRQDPNEALWEDQPGEMRLCAAGE
ncbi:MAG: hypothetical protein CV089_00205 [Nitrospira sp. WS110]|nr:hypothetical protein [Nitrospira sp. WS110]